MQGLMDTFYNFLLKASVQTLGKICVYMLSFKTFSVLLMSEATCRANFRSGVLAKCHTTFKLLIIPCNYSVCATGTKKKFGVCVMTTQAGASEGSEETKHWRGKSFVNYGLPLQCYVCSLPSDAPALDDFYHSYKWYLNKVYGETCSIKIKWFATE